MKVIDVSDQKPMDPRLLVSDFAESLALDRFERSLDRQERRIRKKLEVLRKVLEERQ